MTNEPFPVDEAQTPETYVAQGGADPAFAGDPGEPEIRYVANSDLFDPETEAELDSDEEEEFEDEPDEDEEVEDELTTELRVEAFGEVAEFLRSEAEALKEEARLEGLKGAANDAKIAHLRSEANDFIALADRFETWT